MIPLVNTEFPSLYNVIYGDTYSLLEYNTRITRACIFQQFAFCFLQNFSYNLVLPRNYQD